jgi:proline dehydrogenase
MQSTSYSIFRRTDSRLRSPLYRFLSSEKISQIDFNDSKSSFQAKSFAELLRAKIVFTACQYRFLVVNSEAIIKFSYKSLGKAVTNSFMKETFFGHFCAGEDEKSIRPTVKRLEGAGVGSILDYAAESDVSEQESSVPTSTTIDKVQGRVYDYKNEALCDAHMETFITAIKSVKNVSPTGFAAVKVTALGDPELLRRCSHTLSEIRALFHLLDKEKTGYVTKEEFLKTFSKEIGGQNVLKYFEEIDGNNDGKVDYIEWTNALQLENLHLLVEHCTEKGPLYNSTLTREERELLQRMMERVDHLCALAKSLGVRLMIDAEHSYFQPAIDNITFLMARKYNKTGEFPAIFSTYQMYLKDSRTRLFTDMDRAKKGNFKFAAKLVRGAYMILERQHAVSRGIPDPIHDSLAATHENYNIAVRSAIERIANGEDVEIMIASHNQQSVEIAVQTMQSHGLPASAPVYFGQLLGMSDHLTFSLGAAGYKAYKYVPYGAVHEVLPYLIRRAQENADALSGAKKELRLINAELWRRTKAIFGIL